MSIEKALQLNQEFLRVSLRNPHAPQKIGEARVVADRVQVFQPLT